MCVMTFLQHFHFLIAPAVLTQFIFSVLTRKKKIILARFRFHCWIVRVSWFTHVGIVSSHILPYKLTTLKMWRYEPTKTISTTFFRSRGNWIIAINSSDEKLWLALLIPPLTDTRKQNYYVNDEVSHLSCGKSVKIKLRLHLQQSYTLGDDIKANN